MFNSMRKDLWSCVLFLVEVVFTLLVCNAKVNRIFSLMNRIKTDSRVSVSGNSECFDKDFYGGFGM